MSKLLFSEEEIKQLSKNKYVLKVSNKAITYMPYNNIDIAYLSTIKDGSTNEILAYYISKFA